MPESTSKRRVVEAIRDEISKYSDRDFANEEHFIRDMHIADDDITAVILAVEKRFRVKAPRKRYHAVSNVSDLADVIEDTMRERPTSEGLN